MAAQRVGKLSTQPRKLTTYYDFDPDLDATKGGYLDMSDPETPESEYSSKCSSKSSLSKDQTGATKLLTQHKEFYRHI